MRRLIAGGLSLVLAAAVGCSRTPTPPKAVAAALKVTLADGRPPVAGPWTCASPADRRPGWKHPRPRSRNWFRGFCLRDPARRHLGGGPRAGPGRRRAGVMPNEQTGPFFPPPKGKKAIFRGVGSP